MPGIEKNRIVDVSEKDLDEFTCAICYEVFVNPVVTHCCRQIYCSECINQWLTEHNTCPNDRKQLTFDDLTTAPRLVINLINNMRIKCDYESNGCKTITQISELATHLNDCTFNPEYKCKVCDIRKTGDNEHNCIENLLAKNDRMSLEIKNVTDENDKYIKEILMLKQSIRKFESEKIAQEVNNSMRINSPMKSVIVSARNKINDYIVESETTHPMPYFKKKKLIDRCKEAILKEESYGNISDNLYYSVNQLFNKPWHAIAYADDGGESLVLSKQYFRVRFDKLIIELFVAKQ